MAARPAGAASDLRVELVQLVKKSIDRRRELCRSRILAVLRPMAADVVENALMDDRMVANLALLLPEGAGTDFDQRLAQLDQEHDGRLNFRSVGPLPPYSFATVEVALPSFYAIDRARRTLSLGDTAGRAEIKSAYRRLIQTVHPDLTPAPSADAAEAADLTAAYRMLMSYAEALPAAAGMSVDSGCRFDRPAVEGSILVAVRRQELAGGEGRP